MHTTNKRLIGKQTLRNLLILSSFLLFTQISLAQVTIGSSALPNNDAILDLKQDGETKGGLLLPRVSLQQTTSSAPMSAHTEGMVVYNIASTGDVTPGYYYNNGTKWLKLFSAEDSFFYMPSTVLPTDENDPSFAGNIFTIDLYQRYKDQFALTASNSAVSDNSAKLPVYANNELYYFVIYYDNTVFDEVKISSSGVLTYKIKSGFTYSEKTYMNIVLKVK